MIPIVYVFNNNTYKNIYQIVNMFAPLNQLLQIKDWNQNIERKIEKMPRSHSKS